jgi:hypothetical protein
MAGGVNDIYTNAGVQSATPQQQQQSAGGANQPGHQRTYQVCALVTRLIRAAVARCAAT